MSPRPGSLADRLSAPPAVLVVEDEPDIAALLGAFFRASGLGLVHINPSTIDEVMDAVAEHHPTCVLLDVMLAGISGLDVLETLRATPESRQLPVFVVSADGRPDTRLRAEALGATAFVSKPFSVSALFDQVVEVAGEGSADPSAPDAGAIAGRLAEHLARAQDSGRPLSFVLVQAAGREDDVVRRLRECLPGDMVLGTGEDGEVAAIVPGTDAAETTAALAGCVPACGPDVRAGVAESPAHASTADELYMAADAALAEAVDTGQPVVTAR